MKIKEILARKSSEQQAGVSRPGRVETKHRILQLIKEAEAQFEGTGKSILDIEDYVAEYLAANGVVVLQHGDWIHHSTDENGTTTIECSKCHRQMQLGCDTERPLFCSCGTIMDGADENNRL